MKIWFWRNRFLLIYISFVLMLFAAGCQVNEIWLKKNEHRQVMINVYPEKGMNKLSVDFVLVKNTDDFKNIKKSTDWFGTTKRDKLQKMSFSSDNTIKEDSNALQFNKGELLIKTYKSGYSSETIKILAQSNYSYLYIFTEYISCKEEDCFQAKIPLAQEEINYNLYLKMNGFVLQAPVQKTNKPIKEDDETRGLIFPGM